MISRARTKAARRRRHPIQCPVSVCFMCRPLDRAALNHARAGRWELGSNWRCVTQETWWAGRQIGPAHRRPNLTDSRCEPERHRPPPPPSLDRQVRATFASRGQCSKSSCERRRGFALAWASRIGQTIKWNICTGRESCAQRPSACESENLGSLRSRHRPPFYDLLLFDRLARQLNSVGPSKLERRGRPLWILIPEETEGASEQIEKDTQ